MIYLDNGATSFPKLPQVQQAVQRAMVQCANPGRGGHPAAMAAAETVYRCREQAARMFDCQPEQVVFTANCTHGLNIAIHSLIKPGARVAVSGFEHNAVMRPLYARNVQPVIFGRKLFDPAHTLNTFSDALRQGVSAAVFTHCSNVFGYILPVEEMAELCRSRGIPFIIDAAQSAGSLPVHLRQLGASYIAMPGHKGLQGPQGTGLLLCGDSGEPLLQGGTGSDSENRFMPIQLPERLESGTVNVPGIAGLWAGLQWVEKQGLCNIFQREKRAAMQCVKGLEKLGYRVFSGENQGSVLSFVSDCDCEEMAQKMARSGISVRAGLHCAPLAHESVGTLQTGTVRLSFGHNASGQQVRRVLEKIGKITHDRREKQRNFL